MRTARSIAALLATSAIVLGSARASSAQSVSPDCTVTPSVAGNSADICRKAADLFAFISPQVGVALAGGNPILGEGGTLGGWGKRSITLRLSAVDGQLPKNNVPISLAGSGAVASDFGAKRTPVPMPSVDAAIGLFAGLPMGLTNIGGVDLLAGAIAVPSASSGSFRMEPSGSRVAISYGVRVGILQESSIVPGLSLSWMRRKVPTMNGDYTPSNDTLQVRNASVTANALRVVASKRFLLFGLAAGIGRDDIKAASGVHAVVNESVLGLPQRAEFSYPTLNEHVKRNTAFVNASIGAAILRVVGEVGRSSAGETRNTLNTFGDHKANGAYNYGSLGITVRF